MQPGLRAGIFGLVDRAEVIRLATGGALLTLAINAVGLLGAPAFMPRMVRPKRWRL